MPLPTPTMRRLAIVRYLYTQGLEQERKGGPLAGLALLPLHDAVELFLQVAAEAAAETHSLTMTSKQRTDFMEYWTAFSAAGLPLPYQPQMRGFNSARVEVKHRGLLPIQQQIEEFRSAVTAFLTEAVTKVFQIAFDSISLSSLVRADDVRSALQAAEAAAEAGQFDEALEQAAKAFHLSLRQHRWLATPRLFDPTDAAHGLRQRGRQLDQGLQTSAASRDRLKRSHRWVRASARRSQSWPTISTMTDTDTFGPTVQPYTLRRGLLACLCIGCRSRRQIERSLTDASPSPSTRLFAWRGVSLAHLGKHSLVHWHGGLPAVQQL